MNCPGNYSSHISGLVTYIVVVVRFYLRELYLLTMSIIAEKALMVTAF